MKTKSRETDRTRSAKSPSQHKLNSRRPEMGSYLATLENVV